MEPLSVSLEELAQSFAGRPDLAGSWERVRSGAETFTLEERVILALTEARAHERAGRIPQAMETAQSALEAARSLGYAGGIAGGLTHCALVHYRLGHYAECAQLSAEALAVTDHHPEAVTALHLLGLCASETGNPAQAEEHFHRAADLSRQVNYPLGRALALHNLAALVYFPEGKFDLALTAAAESHQINAALGSPNWGYPMLKAGIYLQLGDREQTRSALDELARHVVPGSMFDGVHCYVSALLALGEDDLERAETLVKRARSIAEATGNPMLNVFVRAAASRYYRLRGEAPAACAWADDALALARRVGFRHLEGQMLIERALAAWQGGDAAAAEESLGCAAEMFTPLGAEYELARAAFFLAALYHQLARPEAGAAWLEAARRIRLGGYGFILEWERALAFPLMAAQARSPDPEARAAAEAMLDQLAKIAPLPLRVVGLGRFEVWQGRRRIPDREWARRRAGELFRFLLLRPHHTAAREAALDSLWPDQPPKAAQAQLHQATSALRRLLEPDLPEKFPSRYLCVEIDQIELRLPSGSRVDFEQFERAISPMTKGDGGRDGADSVSAALDLYGGELFPPDRYADWAAPRRERLAELHLRARLALAQHQLSAGDARAALAHCRAVLAADPWREDAVLAGMTACLALDDRPAALRLYRDLENALRDEFGIAPRADLRQLAESLRR